MPTLAETEKSARIRPPTHSLLARAVTQSAALFNPTTKRNEGRTLRPFCVSRISVTYAKYAPSSSHLKRRTRGPHKVPEQALRARTLYGVSSHPLIAFGQLIANASYPPLRRGLRITETRVMELQVAKNVFSAVAGGKKKGHPSTGKPRDAVLDGGMRCEMKVRTWRDGQRVAGGGSSRACLSTVFL